MNDDLLVINDAIIEYNSYERFLGYSVDIFHHGLNERKKLYALSIKALESKTQNVVNNWVCQWNKMQYGLSNYTWKEEQCLIANEKTIYAKSKIDNLEKLLKKSKFIDYQIDWDLMANLAEFPEINPESSLDSQLKILVYPIRPDIIPYLRKPMKDDIEYKINESFFDKIFPFLKGKKVNKAEQLYLDDLHQWESNNTLIDDQNQSNLTKYEEELSVVKKEESLILAKFHDDMESYKQRLSDYKCKQEAHRFSIQKFKNDYYNGNSEAIISYCELVLINSEYPFDFCKELFLEYNPSNGLLIIEYQLPQIEMLPKIKEVKYFALKDDFKETFLSEIQISKIYDVVLYQIALRSIREIYEADTISAINMVVFNGWVRAINKATGKEENNCILSIQTNKKEFLEIDLRNVDPKVCFKNLKGVAASKLCNLTPIQPLINISKEDKRFITNNEVLDNVDNSQNLASMNWEDFEHLIREIFEKEFKSSGGEVKITQASRDGGVDAVAFDPDPIRGGKIVIQAKRYTNTVGVSAVRDLYGTLMNEGATKGILVTTADYGSDAYDFAKGKPITLLNGANLLFLLEKHGYHARIDIKEAKKLINEQV